MMVVGGQADRRISTVREIEDWVRTARPGDLLIYARGVPSLVGTPQNAAAQKLWAAGKVRLNLRRSPEDRALEYLMWRKAPERIRSSKPKLVPTASIDGRTDAARAYRVLVLNADHGRPCPSNEDLARLAGLIGKDRAAYAMRCLVQAGMIESEIVELKSGARVVTICESGRKTAWPAGVAKVAA
jgi:hypothetical protein